MRKRLMDKDGLWHIYNKMDGSWCAARSRVPLCEGKESDLMSEVKDMKSKPYPMCDECEAKRRPKTDEPEQVELL